MAQFAYSEQAPVIGRIRELLPTGGLGSSLDFQYMEDAITDSVEAEWSPTTILGRSAPIMGYSSTGARELGLTLYFVATEDAVRDVHRKVSWLQSLKYPEYVGTFMRPPRRVRLIIGDFVCLDGILKGAPVSWKGPYDSGNGADHIRPMRAEVQLTIQEIVDSPYDFSRVRRSVCIGANVGASLPSAPRPSVESARAVAENSNGPAWGLGSRE